MGYIVPLTQNVLLLTLCGFLHSLKHYIHRLQPPLSCRVLYLMKSSPIWPWSHWLPVCLHGSFYTDDPQLVTCLFTLISLLYTVFPCDETATAFPGWNGDLFFYIFLQIFFYFILPNRHLFFRIMWLHNWTILMAQFWLKFNAYSAGIDFSRQNLTSVDVRFWRLKSIPELLE